MWEHTVDNWTALPPVKELLTPTASTVINKLRGGERQAASILNYLAVIRSLSLHCIQSESEHFIQEQPAVSLSQTC